MEMLKREIVDQEREYKNQISALETKSHEQWVRIYGIHVHKYSMNKTESSASRADAT